MPWDPFTDTMPFLSSNQHYQSTEYSNKYNARYYLKTNEILTSHLKLENYIAIKSHSKVTWSSAVISQLNKGPQNDIKNRKMTMVESNQN